LLGRAAGKLRIVANHESQTDGLRAAQPAIVSAEGYFPSALFT
jgi:hypothetical protein